VLPWVQLKQLWKNVGFIDRTLIHGSEVPLNGEIARIAGPDLEPAFGSHAADSWCSQGVTFFHGTRVGFS
jgi:hypothetical protein